MIPRSLDHYTIDKIQGLFSESYDFPMEGNKLPRFSGHKNINNLRILETDLVYIVGIPYDQSDYEVNFYTHHIQYSDIPFIFSITYFSQPQNFQ